MKKGPKKIPIVPRKVPAIPIIPNNVPAIPIIPNNVPAIPPIPNNVPPIPTVSSKGATKVPTSSNKLPLPLPSSSSVPTLSNKLPLPQSSNILPIPASSLSLKKVSRPLPLPSSLNSPKPLKKDLITGIKDVDLLVLANLNDRDLFNACLTNKSINKACQNEEFWRKRFISNYDKPPNSRYGLPSKYKKPNETWKKFYLKFIYYDTNYKVAAHLLRKACSIGDLSLAVRALNKYTGTVNIINTEFGLPLLTAAQGNFEDIMIYLMDHGAVVTDSAFAWMCGYCSFYIVKTAVGYNKEVIRIDNDYPIRIAANCDRWEVVKYLESLGANIHSKNDEPLLHATRYASETGDMEMLEYLLNKGADINRVGGTVHPLQTAIKYDNLFVVEYLIDRGANANNIDYLKRAVESKNLDMVKILADKIDNINLEFEHEYENGKKMTNIFDFAKSLNEYEIYDYLRKVSARKISKVI